VNDLENNLPSLPSGWSWAHVFELGEVVTGTTPAKSNAHYYGTDYRFYKPTDLNAGYYVSKSTDGLSDEGLTKARLLPAKSVLVTCIGATIGKTGFIRAEGTSNQQINAIVPAPSLCQEFLYFMCISPGFQRSILENSSSTTLPILNKSRFESLLLPVAPLKEQHRIVTRLEELFSDLDSTEASFRRVKAQLKRYRQSVLKHAVEGKLTAEWREKHRGQIEPADELLKRILAERRAKWEEQELAKMKANGKVPKDQSWKKKYKEPEPPNTEVLPQLPEGWCWASLGQVACHEPNSITDGPFGSNLKTSHYTESGPRVVRLQNIAAGQFVDERAHISFEHFLNLAKHRVFPGDLVVATLGKPVPRACLIPEWLGDAIVKADCIRLKVQDELVVNKYVMLALNSLPIHSWADRIVHGVGRPRLNLEDVRSIPLPLPPKAEQGAIVLDVENKLSIADEIQKTVDANLLRSGYLRDAILRTAFSGHLVPHNPSEEPAAVLLERIRAEREKKGDGKRKIGALLKTPRPRKTRERQERRETQKQLFKGRY